MTVRGHVMLNNASSLGLFIAVEHYFDISTFIGCENWQILFYISSSFGSILPDIDEQESYIGRRLLFLSVPINALIGHRTFTHYFFLPLIIFLSAYFNTMTEIYKIIIYGIAFGILMHDVGDMLTKGGITGFFFPFFPNTTIALLPKVMRFYTNSIEEKIFIFFLFFLNCYLVTIFVNGIIF